MVIIWMKVWISTICKKSKCLFNQKFTYTIAPELRIDCSYRINYLQAPKNIKNSLSQTCTPRDSCITIVMNNFSRGLIISTSAVYTINYR